MITGPRSATIWSEDLHKLSADRAEGADGKMTRQPPWYRLAIRRCEEWRERVGRRVGGVTQIRQAKGHFDGLQQGEV
jgi:hypothetical protein